MLARENEMVSKNGKNLLKLTRCTREFSECPTNTLGRHFNIVLEKPYYLKDKERNKQKQSNTVLDTYE